MKNKLLAVLIGFIIWSGAAWADTHSTLKEVDDLLSINERDKAISVLNVGIKSDPKNPEFYSMRGPLLAEKRQFKAALNDYNSVIKLATKKDHFMLGGAYTNKALIENLWKQSKDAERDFKKAIQVDPKLPISYLEYGKFLMQENRTSEAVPHLEMAKKLMTGGASKKSLAEIDKLIEKAKTNKK